MKGIVCILFLFSYTVSAQSYKTESGEAIFHSKVPLHSFTGSSEHLIGLINLDAKTVDFYLDLATLDTGIGKRDRDMRETLETDKHPFAEFFGKLVSDFDPSISKKQTVMVEGDFKIHGVKRNVRIDGTLQMTDQGLQLYASWILKLADYNIKPPQILFVKVDQEQEIEIKAILTPTEN
ncbi:MAG: YceI family protein [Balneolaceae bacterium]|nr:YceI family protein [Balneolaceae bacterium]